MIKSIGIRREDKCKWERRIAITPRGIKELAKQEIQIKAQSSPIRCYSDEDLVNVGVEIKENLNDCDLLIGVKEMPISFIQPNKPHLFFSHTIKGQSYNMALLKTILERKATLMDYERIVNEKGQRLIAFGRFAGLAGIIDTLAILGRRWQAQKIENPLSKLLFSHEYENLAEAKESIKKIGEEFKKNGLPHGIDSFIVGVPGYGNVSKGVQEILNLLPMEKLTPKELLKNNDGKIAYVILKEEDIVAPKDENKKFELQDYYNNPQNYKPTFSQYISYFSAMVATIYWDERYPRLVTIEDLKKLYADTKNPRLQVIGDISCDVQGAVECTMKTTTPDNPAFVFNTEKENITDGWLGEGVAVLAVDILPAEFSKDASEFFSSLLTPMLKEMKNADFTATLENSNLPATLKSSVIVWQGELTPSYKYLEKIFTRNGLSRKTHSCQIAA